MSRNNTPSGWRRFGVVVGSLAVLAAGGAAVAAQALADTGTNGAGATSGTTSNITQQKTTRQTATKKAGASNRESQQAGQECTDSRGDMARTPVPEAGEAFSTALGAVAEGTVKVAYSVRLSATCHAAAAVLVSADFAPADGSSAGQVAVSYDPASSTISGMTGYEDMSQCWASLEDCQLETLPDGSVLRTFAVHQSLNGGTWEILIAERLVDGYVVQVQAQGPRADDEAGTVLGPDAVLTTEQLVDLVTQLTPVA